MSANKDVKVIYTGPEARSKLRAGIIQSCNLAALTLGPSGSNVVIERQNDFPLITNDGVRIVKRMRPEDEIENMGAEIVAKMAENTDVVGGDGTTTACVLLGKLTEKIIPETTSSSGIEKYTEEFRGPMETKSLIRASCDSVKKKLRDMAKPIETPEDIRMVALVSSESEEVADIIRDMFIKLGKQGQIVVDDSNGFGLESEIIDGYQIEVGLPAIHYANTSRQFCELDSALVLLTNEKLESLGQIDKILSEYMDAKKTGAPIPGSKIVIFCDDYTPEMLGILITLKVKTGLTIVPLRVPAHKKGDVFEDLSAVTGATLIDVSKNESITNTGYNADVWGSCDEILVRHKDTIIKKGHGNTTKELVEKINSEIKDNTQLTQHQIQKMNERISKLTSGIGVIRVGAPSRTEQEYLRFKVDDTVNATKAALQDGVVPGGGVALKTINDSLVDDDILKGVLDAPYKQIMLNIGRTIEIPETIVDPVKVTENSLEKACSVASIVVTTGAVIGIKNKEVKPEEEDYEPDFDERKY